MLVYCWLKRSVPILLLLAAMVASVGILKPLFTAKPCSRRGGGQARAMATESWAVGSAAAQSGGGQVNSRAAGKVDDWVRTRLGWEHEARWFATVGRYEPALHPAVVAALVGMMALWALVAFPANAAGAADEPNAPEPSVG